MHDSWKFLFAFWWLIFPVMGFGMGALQSWLSYRRQHDAMQLLKAYAASGREPPPEVVAALSPPAPQRNRFASAGLQRYGLWFPGLIMFALAGAFAFGLYLPNYSGNEGLRFVVVLFLLLGAAFVAAHFIERRGANRLPPPGGGSDAR